MGVSRKGFNSYYGRGTDVAAKSRARFPHWDRSVQIDVRRRMRKEAERIGGDHLIARRNGGRTSRNSPSFSTSQSC